MPVHLNRREFLRYCAIGAVTLPILQMAGKRPLNERLLQATTASTNIALPSNLPLNLPLSDISMGWDGTVWGIDANGAPYQYDQVAQNWSVYGSEFSAVTYVSKWRGQTSGGNYKFDAPLVVRGTDVWFAYAGPVASIGQTWNNLPDTFTMGLDGAAEAAGVLYLFRHGRYVAIDDATGNASAPVALSTFANWPATANWSQGSFDAIGSNVDDPSYTRVHIWNNLEFITVDMVAKTVVDGPHPLNYYVTDAMLNVMQNGFSAVTFSAVEFNVTAYQGMVVYQATEQNGGIAIQYPSFNDGIWSPTLTHAPSGVVGAMWGVLQMNVTPAPANYGVPVYHDGTGWQGSVINTSLFTHISAGSDGTVFGVILTNTNDYALAQLQADGSTWTQIVNLPVPPAHLSVGNANHVWLLGTDNKVYRYAGSAFTQVTTIDMATHIAANPDGTVWHAKGDPYAYRFISESTAAATQLEIANGNAVNKVASIGFATAYVLADNTTLQAQTDVQPAAAYATTALYAYDSIYVWKTSQTYIPQWDNQFACYGLIPAGSNVYLVAHDPNFANENSFLVAIDAQTGLEVWPNRFVIPNSTGYVFAGIVYDVTLNYIYFGFANAVYAVDCGTGLLAWQYTGPAMDVYTIPNLCDGALYFGNQYRDGTGPIDLYRINTLGAANAGKQGQPVVLDWTAALPGPADGTPCYIGQPVSPDGSDAIYVVFRSAGTGSSAYYVTAVDGSDGSIIWNNTVQGENFDGTLTVLDCVVGQTQPPSAGASQTALFVNAGSAISALDTTDGTTLQSYMLPTGRLTSSGISIYSNQLYIGDTAGTLYVIDGTTMQVVANTTDAFQNTWLGVLGKPAVIHSEDPTDPTVGVYFARGDDNLWLFDPSSGNLEQVSTDLNASILTGYDAVHGMLYSAGWNGGTGPLGQIFAMRPDQALQDERSFIIESELMQDFASDDEAAGNGVARYQTHITIVDGNNAPLGNTAIKVWSAGDETDILIDGTPFTVGGAAPASFTLDATGTCTLLSVAGDLFSPTFTVWAPFMSPNECIVVQPDAAFHQRLSGVTASGSTDPSQTAPQQIDLSNAASFDGTPLFSTSSDDQATASQAAPAISQAMTSAGFGPATASAARPAGVNAALPKYTAYANLPAMRYRATSGQSIPSPLSPGAPAGVAMTANGVALMTPAAASALIDAMEGEEDVAIAALGGVLNKLKAAWSKIKQAAAKVVQVVVSVAKDIAVGIQYVVDGVIQVVKAVAQDIEDVMISIGSFFVQLGKEIDKTIEALSLLLHLDEVIKTAALLNTQINASFADITNVLNAAQSTVDNWFNGVSNKIAGDFCDLYSSLGLPTPTNCGTGSAGVTSATPFNTYNSVGSTSNTLFNTGNTSGQSQSVQCGWSSHTLRKNLGGASTPTNTVQAGAAQDDPFLDFLTGFGSKLQSDPALSAALSATGNAFKSTFKVNSVAEFMQMALEDLLETIQLAALAGAAVVQTLLDGVFASISTVVAGLQNLGNMNIPVLSALWKKLTGNDLTFLDVICFVMAFPVTLMYRAKAGNYPSQAVSAADSTLQMTRNILGLFGSIAQFVLGIVTAFMDFLGAAGASIPFPAVSVGWKIAAILALATLAANNVFKADLTPNTYPLLASAFSLALPIYLALNVVSVLPPAVVSFCGLGINALLVYVYVETFVNTSNQTEQVKLTLSRSVIASFTGIVNPVKFAGLPVGLVTLASDLVCRTAAGVITAIQTYETWDAALGEESPAIPFRNNSFLPFVGR